MNKQTKNILILLVVGVGAYMIWKKTQSKPQVTKNPNEPKLNVAGSVKPPRVRIPYIDPCLDGQILEDGRCVVDPYQHG